jgi:cytochrome c1
VFWLLVLGLLLGAGGLVVIYFRNRLRKEMNKELKMQVSTAVEHYFQLTESTVSK